MRALQRAKMWKIAPDLREEPSLEVECVDHPNHPMTHHPADMTGRCSGTLIFGRAHYLCGNKPARFNTCCTRSIDSGPIRRHPGCDRDLVSALIRGTSEHVLVFCQLEVVIEDAILR